MLFYIPVFGAVYLIILMAVMRRNNSAALDANHRNTIAKLDIKYFKIMKDHYIGDKYHSADFIKLSTKVIEFSYARSYLHFYNLYKDDGR